jgi:hypothetical protein
MSHAYSLAMAHRYYQHVDDLPGLVTPAVLEIDFDALTLTETAPAPARSAEQVAAAVAEWQAPGRTLQAKVDGCWACVDIGHEGRVDAVWSRADIPLRQGKPWLGETTSAALTGWHFIGELEAGTTRAHIARRERGELDQYGRSVARPRLHIYGAVDPSGRDRTADIGDICTCLPGEMRPVQVATGAWGGWTEGLLRGGGEGVVIRDGEQAWRAKASATYDRIVMAADSCSAGLRLTLGAYVGSRIRSLQQVVAPAWWNVVPTQRHRPVVEVVGWGEHAGVIRHAQIARIRDDKPAAECCAA